VKGVKQGGGGGGPSGRAGRLTREGSNCGRTSEENTGADRSGKEIGHRVNTKMSGGVRDRPVRPMGRTTSERDGERDLMSMSSSSSPKR
jgi:hypothetical protein